MYPHPWRVSYPSLALLFSKKKKCFCERCITNSKPCSSHKSNNRYDCPGTQAGIPISTWIAIIIPENYGRLWSTYAHSAFHSTICVPDFLCISHSLYNYIGTRTITKDESGQLQHLQPQVWSRGRRKQRVSFVTWRGVGFWFCRPRLLRHTASDQRTAAVFKVQKNQTERDGRGDGWLWTDGLWWRRSTILWRTNDLLLLVCCPAVKPPRRLNIYPPVLNRHVDQEWQHIYSSDAWVTLLQWHIPKP